MVKAIFALVLGLMTAPITSERVDVRDRDSVDLATFECRDITRSTLIQRVCYDAAQRRLLVASRGAYEQFCEVPAPIFHALMDAPSMGLFFNRNIRGAAPANRQACAAQTGTEQILR